MQPYLFSELPLEPLLPVSDPLADERLHGRDVDHLRLGGVPEHFEHGDLGSDRLPRAGGRAEQKVLVRVVQAVENLRLQKKNLQLFIMFTRVIIHLKSDCT